MYWSSFRGLTGSPEADPDVTSGHDGPRHFAGAPVGGARPRASREPKGAAPTGLPASQRARRQPDCVSPAYPPQARRRSDGGRPGAPRAEGRGTTWTPPQAEGRGADWTEERRRREEGGGRREEGGGRREEGGRRRVKSARRRVGQQGEVGQQSEWDNTT